MPITIDGILEKTIAGIIGGLIATALIKLSNILRRPKIDISFDEKDTFGVLPIDNIEGKPDGLYVHLKVENTRPTMAYGCKVFLLKLERKEQNKFKPIDIKVHLTLKWANENEPKGYEGLEIPGNYRRRVDFMHSIKGSNIFVLFIEGGSRGLPNVFLNGEYRFTIQASGKNTNTVTKRFIVTWEGTFEKDNLKIDEERKRLFKKLESCISANSIFQ